MVRVLTEINPVLGPVQPCTIRNLQHNSVSHECVYIWKYGLSVCSCESSRKDPQSKQGRRVPEQGGARLVFRCDAEARITKRGEAGRSANTTPITRIWKSSSLPRYHSQQKPWEIYELTMNLSLECS